MDQEFEVILKQMIKTQGKDVLLDKKRFKPLITDFTRNQFKKETNLLKQMVDADCTKYINDADNVADVKTVLVKRLEDEYGMSPKATTELLDLLGYLLRGNTEKTIVPVSIEISQGREVKPKIDTLGKRTINEFIPFFRFKNKSQMEDTDGNSSPSDKSKKVLILIEKYTCKPYPKSEYNEKETYDYRIESGNKNPSTLIDTFICDIWQRIDMDLKYNILPENVTLEIINDAFEIYNKKDWNHIAGYRPWTHWNFINSLTPADKQILANETLQYIVKYGIRDVE